MWAAFILAQLPETPHSRRFVDPSSRLNHDKGVHRSHESSFPISLSAEEMRTIERVPIAWEKYTQWRESQSHGFESDNFENNIYGTEMFLQREIRSSKNGIGGHTQLNGSMCYVIVTGRSLLWTLLSLVALMAVLSGLITPKWLIGPQMKDTSNYFISSVLSS